MVVRARRTKGVRKVRVVGTDTDIAIRCTMKYRTRDKGDRRRGERLGHTYGHCPGSFVLRVLPVTGSRALRRV